MAKTARPWLILFVAWLGWVFDIMDTALFNFARKPMLIDMLGEEGYKAGGAALEGTLHFYFLIGWAIGGLFFGLMADRWGRTRTMMITILMYCLFTGITAFCKTPEQVMVVRFFTGLGIGGEWAAGAALVAESFSDRMRPTAAACLQTAAAFGPWMASALNLWLNQPGALWLGQFHGWQMLYLVGVVPAVAALLIRVWVPEPVHIVRAGSAVEGLRALFAERQSAKRAMLVLVIGAVGIAGAMNATYWLPNLVTSVTPNKDEVTGRLTLATFILHFGTLAGVFFFPWLAKTKGRKMALGLGFGLAILSTAALVILPHTYESLLVMAPLIAFPAIGVTAVFGLYFPELFPSKIRATGAGFGYNFARLLTAPIPIWTGMMMKQYPQAPVIGVGLAALIYLIGVGALFVAPETKDQPLPA